MSNRKLMRDLKLRRPSPPTIALTYLFAEREYTTEPSIAYPVIDKPTHFKATFDVHGIVRPIRAVFEARDFGYRSVRPINDVRPIMLMGDQYVVAWTVTFTVDRA